MRFGRRTEAGNGGKVRRNEKEVGMRRGRGDTGGREESV